MSDFLFSTITILHPHPLTPATRRPPQVATPSFLGYIHKPTYTYLLVKAHTRHLETPRDSGKVLSSPPILLNIIILQ